MQRYNRSQESRRVHKEIEDEPKRAPKPRFKEQVLSEADAAHLMDLEKAHLERRASAKEVLQAYNAFPRGPEVGRRLSLLLPNLSAYDFPDGDAFSHFPERKIYIDALEGALSPEHLSQLVNSLRDANRHDGLRNIDLSSLLSDRLFMQFSKHIECLVSHDVALPAFVSFFHTLYSSAQKGSVVDRVIVSGVSAEVSKKIIEMLFEVDTLVSESVDGQSLLDGYSHLFTAEEHEMMKRRVKVGHLGKMAQDVLGGYVDHEERLVVEQKFAAFFAEDFDEYSQDEIAHAITFAEIVGYLITVEQLAKQTGSRSEAEAAFTKAFSLMSRNNASNAIQFAWRNSELNILNIPVALSDTGLVQGSIIPREISDCLVRHISEGTLIDRAALCARKTHGITPREYTWLKDRNPDGLRLVGGKPNAEGILEDLSGSDGFDDGVWDGEIVRRGMQTFRDLVGADIALRYANRTGLSRHDAFHFAADVEVFFRGSGMSKKEFADILLQVAADGSSYDVGTAYHQFAAIMQECRAMTVQQILTEADEFQGIPELGDLVRSIREGSQRPSWKRLKKIYDLYRFLLRRELLEELSRGDMSPKLRNYVSKLAFHPNIAMNAVVRFWKQPDEFLEIDDANTSHEINASKKPSNYLSLPYLGMNAVDLRDALVEGSVDRVQTLPAFERTYTLYADRYEDPRLPENLHRFLRKAIGQQRLGIPGRAKDARKLFAEVQGWCKANNVKWTEIWDEKVGVTAMKALSSLQQESLSALVFDSRFGIEQPQGEIYHAKIGHKSDVDVVVAGNDTASCMPFGSGKNNVYMYNPNCAQMVVQRKTGEDTWRTIAQSVVNIDVETGKPTPALIAGYKENGARLKDLLDISVLQKLGVVTCDNIEVAKNDEGKRTAEIATIYNRFFQEYLQKNARAMNCESQRVIIGMGYTPVEFGFDATPNTFVPLAPMGYSDNVGPESLVLKIDLPAETFTPRAELSPMTTRDVFAVALLEGKAYHDNVSLLENLHGMQNNIIGMEIANAHFKRPNLSFIYHDGKGVPKGYMLAYEGVNAEQSGIYISDLAADPESKLAGGKLITKFFETYTSYYGKNEQPFLPIITNARDQTSYRILQSQLERLSARAGLVAEMVETSTYMHENDLFHDVVIFIGHDAEDVENQKRSYRFPIEQQG